MSKSKTQQRISCPAIQARKGPGSVVCLTAYTAYMAKILDSFVDLILVGDSVAMVQYGMTSTLGISLETMINHGKAVAAATRRSCVVVDMPFGSYQESPQSAFRAAAKVLAETRAQAVKLEGGKEMAETVRFLVARGVPVMTHIGLMPQHANTMGGFKAQGLTEESQKSIYEDAVALEKTGTFAMVIEGTGESLARKITEQLSIPTIGIGASPACDGQVLVTEDILGVFTDFTPKFVKRYANIQEQITQAVQAYADDVKTGRFPQIEHCFGASKSKS